MAFATIDTRPTVLGLALVEAAFEGNREAVKKLLREKTPADSKDWNGSTPLMMASAAGHLGIVGMLVDSGANVNARGDWGVTPFDRATAYGHRNIMKFLYENGARKNAKGQFGRTAMEWTAAFRPEDARFIRNLRK